jgi:2-hydroxychromene-2-carboxylate isomerase
MRFLFDYVSPYSYLASTQIRAIAAAHGRTVTPVPVLFAAMLDASGSMGPAEIPAKREYMRRDVMRLSRALGVPIAPPATHPFNSLAALRATGCVDDGAARWAVVDAIFRATWVDAEHVDDPGVLARVISGAAAGAGVDGAVIVRAASDPDAKARLRRDTDEAIAAGAFGVPTVFADDEPFWGVDSLPLLDHHLAGERASTPEDLERWRRVQPSAQRRAARRG